MEEGIVRGLGSRSSSKQRNGKWKISTIRSFNGRL